VQQGVTDKRRVSQTAHWGIWTKFCEELELDPWLWDCIDPVPILQVFMCRVHDGRLAPSGQPVSARHAEDVLRSVGQTFSSLGSHDPRKDRQTGRLDFRLYRQERTYKAQDRPTPKKRPIPREVLHQAARMARHKPEREQAINDLIWIGFYFLLRPSEYLWTTVNQHPFTLKDIVFRIHDRRYPASTIPLELLDSVTFLTYTFTEQKNGIRNEEIGLARSRDQQACPVRCTANRVRHLRTHLAPPDTPIFAFFDATRRQLAVSDRMITHYLRKAADGTPFPGNYTVGALRNSGAQALLEAGVPKAMIQLIGRWRSDEIFRYLTANSEALMHPYSESMISPPTTPRRNARGT
jgi:hypothetical protein